MGMFKERKLSAERTALFGFSNHGEVPEPSDFLPMGKIKKNAGVRRRLSFKGLFEPSLYLAARRLEAKGEVTSKRVKVRKEYALTERGQNILRSNLANPGYTTTPGRRMVL